MTHQAITIDGPASLDLDDALWAEPLDGGVQLRVFVADPARMVAVGSDVDLRAWDMVETHYFPTGSKPMLPPGISEHRASLLAGRRRRVLEVCLRFDRSGERIGYEVRQDVEIRSTGQLHYGQVPEILGNENDRLHPQVRLLTDLAQILLARRRREGALALYDLSTGLLTSEEGSLRWVEEDRSTLGHVVVQEAMIAANGALAEFCAQKQVPVLFRNHEASAACPQREDLQRWLAEMVVVPRDLAAQRARVLETVLGRARYGVELRGHFGLALGAYMHATSPIRRLADLINHRQVGAYLRGQELPYHRDTLSEAAERINAWKDAQRERKTERMKEKADQLLSRRAAIGMRSLEPSAFSRVVKLAVRSPSAPDPALQAEVSRRCREGTLMPMDACHILWAEQDAWAPLRQDVARFLEDYPHVAVSLESLSATLTSSPIKVDSVAPDASGFVATASRRGFQLTGQGRTKKAASQDALLRHFCAMAGIDRRTAADAPAPAPATTAAPCKPSVRLPDPESVDPISEIQLYCQASGIDLPAYQYEEKTERGKPMFACQISISALRITASSAPKPSKKEAKREAALRAIQTLRADRCTA